MLPLKSDRPSLYNTDYLQWIKTTVEKLHSRDYANVDWDNLIEEIEDIGRSEQGSLESNLIVLLLHLLKWQYQPERRSGSWESSIIEHRRRIKQALKESPSLKTYFESIFSESYIEAVKQAKAESRGKNRVGGTPTPPELFKRAETGLPLETFPSQCPYELAALLDDEFLPLP